MKAFQRLYGAASPFDPTNRQDQLGEDARRHLLITALSFTEGVKDRGDLPHLLGGLLVGIVQVLQATAGTGDETDAAIRASIIQIAPWAVDMARSAQGKEPLADA